MLNYDFGVSEEERVKIGVAKKNRRPETLIVPTWDHHHS